MPAPVAFPLRPFPRRVMRSLAMFALAGAVFAAVVWQDGMGRPWLPLVLLAASSLVPLLFALQIRATGFDPLERLVVTDEGLEAHFRDGTRRTVPWPAMRRLVQVEGFRYRAWAVTSLNGPLRWFGELEDPDGFAALVAERSRLSWEHLASMPEDGI